MFKRLLWITALISTLAFFAAAQDQPQTPPPPTPSAPQGEAPHRGGARGEGGPGMGGMMGMGGNAGQITEISGNALKITTSTGKVVSINLNAETLYRGSDRSELSLKDFKVGDAVLAGGPQGEDGSVTARLVVKLDEAAQKRLQEMRENLGKTYIAGEIKEINDTRLTILRPDGQTQVIELDENTSIKKHNESITLADVKVGERVMGQGELKNGVFVPKDLRVGMPMRRMERSPNQQPQ